MKFDQRTSIRILAKSAAAIVVVAVTSWFIHVLTSEWFRELGIPVSAGGSIVLAVLVLGAVFGLLIFMISLLRVVRWGVGVPAPRTRHSH